MENEQLDQQLLARLRRNFSTDMPFAWDEEWPARDYQGGAGVLIAIVPQARGLAVLLTRRTEHLYHHPGQISFPGGRLEESDASTIDAALREAEEEIGLPRDQVEVLGTLPEYGTSSGFRVTPVVGLVPPDFLPKLDAFEVAELFSVPLRFLLDRANYQRHRVQRDNVARHFYAVPWPGRFIWGATAGMLAMFAAFMAHADASGASVDRGLRQAARADLGAPAAGMSASGVYST
jgi:8-oxo-dGTP pyrophosphatase MutT (NUDIX family)